MHSRYRVIGSTSRNAAPIVECSVLDTALEKARKLTGPGKQYGEVAVIDTDDLKAWKLRAFGIDGRLAWARPCKPCGGVMDKYCVECGGWGHVEDKR